MQSKSTVVGQVSVEIAVDRGFELGEGGRSYDGGFRWVDLLVGQLWELDFAVGVPRRLMQLDVPLGAAAPLPDGRWIAACGPGFAIVGPESQLTWLHRPEEVTAGRTRMNDAAVDPAGRFLAGSMSTERVRSAGALYSLEVDGSLSTLVEGITTPNGPVFSLDGRRMYLADSREGQIYAWDYEPLSGQNTNKTLFADLGGDGSPDGMTIDADDHLWSAVWGGSEVRRYDPDGALVTTINLPSQQPTSCTFAGEDLAELYVTTATRGLGRPTAVDGRVLVCRGTGVRGVTPALCKVDAPITAS